MNRIPSDQQLEVYVGGNSDPQFCEWIESILETESDVRDRLELVKRQFLTKLHCSDPGIEVDSLTEAAATVPLVSEYSVLSCDDIDEWNDVLQGTESEAGFALKGIFKGDEYEEKGILQRLSGERFRLLFDAPLLIAGGLPECLLLGEFDFTPAWEQTENLELPGLLTLSQPHAMSFKGLGCATYHCERGHLKLRGTQIELYLGHPRPDRMEIDHAVVELTYDGPHGKGRRIALVRLRPFEGGTCLIEAPHDAVSPNITIRLRGVDRANRHYLNSLAWSELCASSQPIPHLLHKCDNGYEFGLHDNTSRRLATNRNSCWVMRWRNLEAPQ